MIVINEEYEIEKGIDRACSAQSSDLMPKLLPSPEEERAKKLAMERRIQAKFKGK